MTDVKENLERKAFEEWYCSKTSESIGMKRYLNGRFRNPETENMYLAWRAAKSHAEEYGWISVEDRYPENGQEVNILLNTGEVRIALHEAGTPGGSDFTKGHYFTGDIYHIDGAEYNCSLYGDNVTHWQPLPTPPRQGDK